MSARAYDTLAYRAVSLLKRFFVVLTVLAGLSLVPAGAEPVPAAATGVWGETGCNDGGRMFLVNASYVMDVRLSGTSAAVAVHPAQWVAGVVLVDTGQGMEILALEGLKRCPSLPPLLHASFGEAIALFRAYDDLHPRCGGEHVVPVGVLLGAAEHVLPVDSQGLLAGVSLGGPGARRAVEQVRVDGVDDVIEGGDGGSETDKARARWKRYWGRLGGES